ncbi:hypothetical protein J1TS5_03740 [Paenibacillus macerans]|uniref:hypothetical protein n=1 Tax=Paenibacillus macerans TaxID=44252 RepID=UPI001B2EABEE|nr:hypothetical protein [Paenibacillus macerans]GIP08204.1 hypothetical protein J1TS5_03740 [Paenibacillus macerans]
MDINLLQILFWNIKRKDLSKEIHALIKEHRCPELIVLSETTQRSRKEISNILMSQGYISRTPINGNVRVAIFDKLDSSAIKYLRQDQRFTSIVYDINNQKFMIVGIHLDSPVSYPDVTDRYVRAADYSIIIEQMEKTWEIKKTLLIGDFNMNPFDKGMVSELSFKATHCKQTAKRETGNKRYFFNPSWKLFSNDLTQDNRQPPGTIHYVPHNKDTYVDYWHVFDQVLIRSELISSLSNSFEVITNIGSINLLNQDLVPDRELYSDHLPIKYQIEV